MNTQWKAPPCQGRAWTPEEVAELSSLRVSGKTAAECAQIMGLGYDRVKDKIKNTEGPAHRRRGRTEPFHCIIQTERKERKCLSCTRPFISDGIHNRMCDPCRRAV